MNSMHYRPDGCVVPQSRVAASRSSRPATATHAVRPVARTPATPGSARNGPGPTPEAVHDGRMPFLKTLEQFVSPREYVDKVLAGHTYAWGKTGLPGKDTLVIADVEAARSILASELQLGVGSDWPDTIRGMLGTSSLSVTTDQQLHARLRQYLGMAFTKDAIQQMLPELQGLVAGHMARWAAAVNAGSSTNGSGSSSSSSAPALVGLVTTPDSSMLLAYPAVRMLTFESLVNIVLGLRMSQEEVCQSAVLFQGLVDGFMPPAWDLPFTAYGKGLKSRQQLTARIQQTLSSPDCSGPLARLRNEFGADSPVAIDNTITMLFAGFDTTSSSITYMLWLLAEHPEVLEKIHAEQAAIVSLYGSTLTPEAYAAMEYTMATVKETLRAAQIIGYVPRVATRELQVPGGPALPAGCPFLVALAAISQADPALQAAGDAQLFKPERWLEPGASKALIQHQLPFGTGQRTCLGMNLANAEMVAVLAELGRSYTLTADVDTEFNDFPIKKPTNGLPFRLSPRG